MECRETGEFAHRELTRFEQVESFNDEVVGEVEWADEYVHLKSKLDEFHYVDSTKDNEGQDGEDGRKSPGAIDSPRPRRGEQEEGSVGDGDGQETVNLHDSQDEDVSSMLAKHGIDGTPMDNAHMDSID